jgi:dienelactone hydrolase
MRSAWLTALVFLISCPVRAQSAGTNVFDWKAATTLNAYLTRQLHAQYAGRPAELARAAQSAAGAVAYRDSVRARFRRVLGPLPARTPLHAQVMGQMVRPDFRVEKIVFESTPNHHVTASLYLPAGTGQWPGVLLPCGHENEAKATVSYQKTAILLATHGFAVLMPDPISQGERMQLTDAAGKPLTRGGTTEHTLLNAEAALLGYSLPAAELWDNVRALDYLVSRAEVDTARLGCVGNSGGATQTAYLMAVDKRLKAAALCSYVAAGERNLELTGPADGCVMLPGAGRVGLDLADWLIMFAPRPLLLLAGRYDFVDYSSIEAAYAETNQLYKALGHAERTQFFAYDDGHGISQPKREVAVRWFQTWLAGVGSKAEAVKESVLPVATTKELQCTPTAQVNTAFPQEENLNAFYQAEARWLAAARPAVAPQALPHLLEQQLGRETVARFRPDEHRPVEVEHRDTLRRNGLAYEKLILRGETGMPLPALLLAKAAVPKARKSLLVCFSDRGKAVLADSTGWLREQLTQHDAVLLVDLRGQGETTDPTAAIEPKYYNREYRPALLSLHAGKPLLTQRIEDVATVVQFCTQAWGNAPVTVCADGRTAALAALHAAVLTSRIGEVRLRALPASYQSQLATPTAKDVYSDLLPGVLRRYDVADLQRALGRRLVLR